MYSSTPISGTTALSSAPYIHLSSLALVNQKVLHEKSQLPTGYIRTLHSFSFSLCFFAHPNSKLLLNTNEYYNYKH